MDSKLFQKLTNEYIQCPCCKKEKDIKAESSHSNGLIISCKCGWELVFDENGDKFFELYKDEIGGSHSDGVGWTPYGIFCGECNLSTCKGCKHRFDNKND